MAFRIHVHRDLSGPDLRAICSSHGVNAALTDLPLDQIFISFDEFCSLVSEYKQRAGEQPKAWDSLVTKTVHFLGGLVQPVARLASWVGHAVYPGRGRTSSGGSRSSNLGRRGSSVRDVYLGGSINSVNWRLQTAIPMLKKSGLTYYNPAICSSKRLIPIEASAMDNSRVLLFVIQGSARSVSAMAQAASASPYWEEPRGSPQE